MRNLYFIKISKKFQSKINIENSPNKDKNRKIKNSEFEKDVKLIEDIYKLKESHLIMDFQSQKKQVQQMENYFKEFILKIFECNTLFCIFKIYFF